MIVVTGTMRSGTSLWMQVLKAAGLPVLGSAFPAAWGETLRDANEHGFYESALRHGIYYKTNPSPQTGKYLTAKQSRGLVVKVFIPGVVRSERAYLDRVIGTVRHWREQVTSMERLRALERDALAARGQAAPTGPRRAPPELQWWLENYLLLRDVAERGYPVHLVTYDRLLADPAGEIGPVLRWIGVGDLEAACAVVRSEARTQVRSAAPVADAPFAAAFDELFDTLHERRPITPALLGRLNDTHTAVLAHLEAMGLGGKGTTAGAGRLDADQVDAWVSR